MDKVLIVINPIAGGKAKLDIVEYIINGLDTRFNVDVQNTEYPSHATTIV